MNKLAVLGLSLVTLVSAGCAGGQDDLASAQQAAAKQGDPSSSGPQAMSVAGADGVGWTVGSTIGGITGGPGGWLAGGVIGGAAASLHAAWQNWFSVRPTAPVTIDPSNPANPFDDAGKLHNAALDAALLRADDGACAQDPAAFRAWLRPILWDFAAKQLGASPKDLADPALDAAYQGALDAGDVALVDPEAAAGAIAGLSDEARDLLRAYYATVDGLGADATVQITKDFEQVVIDSPMGDVDKHALLGGFSVARYSAAYWANASNDPASPWGRCFPQAQ
jgi:hypothetical protein